MDIGSAFTYMFDDEEWIKKFVIGGVALLLGILIVPILLVYGYAFQTLKNIRDNHPRPLPEWDDFGTLIIEGLKVAVIVLVYNIPTIFFYCAAMAVNIGASQADSDIQGGLAAVVMCLYCVLFLLFILGFGLFPAGLIRYAQYGTLGSAFQFGEIFSFIKQNIGDYIIAVLLSFVAINFISGFGVILLCVGVFLTQFWSFLVTANLLGQLARKASSSPSMSL